MNEDKITIADIILHPHPILRCTCEPVAESEFGSETLKKTVTEMSKTLLASQGLGLAAPQIGIDRRIFVRVCQKSGGIKAYCNPTWEALTDKMFAFKEGCLSIPDVFGVVRRPEKILVKARDIDGNEFEEILVRLESTCVQHECDHLDGKEFIDYLSDYQKKKILVELRSKYIRRPSEYERIKAILDDAKVDSQCPSEPSIILPQ